MNAERWRAASPHLDRALEMSREERVAWLASLRAEDPALAADLEALLAHNEAVGRERFLEDAAPPRPATVERLAVSEAAELTGRTIARYRVLSLLGAGAMGSVYLAEDKDLGRRVALKVLPEHFSNDQDRVQRFRREARAASALNHPGILTVYEVGHVDGAQFIAGEYVEGETLRARLAHAPLRVSEALEVATQVADALAAAHEAGIIHRDVKPENIMVRPDGYVKVLDFGLAKLAEPLLAPHPGDVGTQTTPAVRTNPGVVMGTAEYMSPEQMRGLPVDASTDVWSVGVVVYEMLAGRRPFEEETHVDTSVSILAREPEPLRHHAPGIPVALEAIVMKALAKDRQERYPTARNMALDLRRLRRRLELVDEGGILTQPASSPATGVGPRQPTAETDAQLPSLPLGRASRRPFAHRRVLAAAAVLGSLAGGLGIVVLWPHRPIAVVVQDPRVTSSAGDEPSSLAAFALKEAVLTSLAGLERIELIGRAELPQTALSVQDLARAVAADEVVVPAMACDGQWCHVALRRHRGRDASILSDSGAFDVPSQPEDSLALARAVDIHVREAFPEHRAKAAGRGLEVDSADYERYLLLRRRTEAGETLGAAEILALDQITRSSPGLADAYLLAAGTARARKDRLNADRILREAEDHHRGDPRLASERFTLELEIGTMAAAETALAALEKLVPGDIRVWRARAGLLSRQGKLREATEVYRRLARQRPSWRNLSYVADAEIELAETKSARLHLEQLLQVSPGNQHGLSKLARLEWLTGDPMAAVRIYQGLLEKRVTRLDLSNLAWSLLLAGEYADSVTAYRRALEMEPDHLLSRLNLAIAEDGVGDADEAQRLYRALLDAISQREGKGPLLASERLIKAQALARLGQRVPAVDLTVQTLRENERDAQVTFQAAIIYAICGEQNNAIVHATEARQRGLSPRWFGIPGFESLQTVPAFQALLASD